jgi:glycosyltransferase involved in cell wall biosynthesis
VTFYDYQNNMDSWYQASAVTLIPFQREGLSRGMIESLSYGTPVISFDVCSAKEILEGDAPCGIVVPQDNYEKMISALHDLIKNKEQYNCYSKNGILLSRNLFEKSKVIKVYEDAYLC